jgi:hypothetical protein
MTFTATVNYTPYYDITSLSTTVRVPSRPLIRLLTGSGEFMKAGTITYEIKFKPATGKSYPSIQLQWDGEWKMSSHTFVSETNEIQISKVLKFTAADQFLAYFSVYGMTSGLCTDYEVGFRDYTDSKPSGELLIQLHCTERE